MMGKIKKEGKWVPHDLTEIQIIESHQGNHEHVREDQITSERRQCPVFGDIKRVLFIINFSNLVKQLMLLATDNK